MSSISPVNVPLPFPVPVTGNPEVHIEDRVRIPANLDLEAFRRWAKSDEFPQRGRFAFLNGIVWVDLSMEQLYTHNQVKGEVSAVLMPLVRSLNLGRFVPDGMFLSNPAANLSTVPDGVFLSFNGLRSGRIRQVPGARTGFIELEGSPEMVLEVVSDSSVHKDTEVLPHLYWQAGVNEYWLIDARGAAFRFDLFRHTPNGYLRTPEQDGWLFSQVFGRSFRFDHQTDPLGQPLYTLAVRE